MARYGKKAGEKVERAMHEMKRGQLKSGRSGKTVKSRDQAIAIGLSEARKEGGKVPSAAGSSKKSASKKASKKSSAGKAPKGRDKAKTPSASKSTAKKKSSSKKSSASSKSGRKRSAGSRKSD